MCKTSKEEVSKGAGKGMSFSAQNHGQERGVDFLSKQVSENNRGTYSFGLVPSAWGDWLALGYPSPGFSKEQGPIHEPFRKQNPAAFQRAFQTREAVLGTLHTQESAHSCGAPTQTRKRLGLQNRPT